MIMVQEGRRPRGLQTWPSSLWAEVFSHCKPAALGFLYEGPFRLIFVGPFVRVEELVTYVTQQGSSTACLLAELPGTGFMPAGCIKAGRSDQPSSTCLSHDVISFNAFIADEGPVSQYQSLCMALALDKDASEKSPSVDIWARKKVPSLLWDEHHVVMIHRMGFPSQIILPIWIIDVNGSFKPRSTQLLNIQR